MAVRTLGGVAGGSGGLVHDSSKTYRSNAPAYTVPMSACAAVHDVDSEHQPAVPYEVSKETHEGMDRQMAMQSSGMFALPVLEPSSLRPLHALSGYFVHDEHTSCVK